MAYIWDYKPFTKWDAHITASKQLDWDYITNFELWGAVLRPCKPVMAIG